MDTRALVEKLGIKEPSTHPAVCYTVITPSELELVKILEEDPSLVSATFNKAQDLSGRCLLNNTLLQLAFGAGDYALCRVLAPFYVKAYGNPQAGKEAFLQQLREKFLPALDEEKKAAVKRQIRAIISPVIEVITCEALDQTIEASTAIPHKRPTPNPVTKKAIEQYNESLKILFSSEIEKGRHFWPEALVEAFRLLDQTIGKLSYYQRVLYEDAVLAPILSLAPAIDAQHFCQGLASDKSFKRSLIVRNGEVYYDSLKKPSWELDVNSSFVDPRSGVTASYTPLGSRLGPDINFKTTEMLESYYLERDKQLDLIMQGKLFEQKDEEIAKPAPVIINDDDQKKVVASNRGGCVMS